MARGLSHRGLRRLPDRSPCPPRRDHRNRRRILPPQRSNRTLRETRASTPRSQTMIAEQPKSPPSLPLTTFSKLRARDFRDERLSIDCALSNYTVVWLDIPELFRDGKSFGPKTFRDRF